MKKIMDNKVLKFIVSLIRIVVWIIAIMVVILILVQRVFNNKVALGNYRLFTIASGSMLPEYKIMDVILVGSKDYDKIKVGDDLVYMGKVDSYKDKIITHRVINIENKNGVYEYTTKGINNPLEDPIVSQDQVYGVVKYKTVVLSFLSGILNNSFGFYFLVFVPIAFLIFLEIIDFIKSKEEELDEGE